MKRNKNILFSGFIILACLINVSSKGITKENSNALRTGFKKFMTSIRPLGKNRYSLLKNIKAYNSCIEKAKCDSKSNLHSGCSLHSNSAKNANHYDCNLSNTKIHLRSLPYCYSENPNSAPLISEPLLFDEPIFTLLTEDNNSSSSTSVDDNPVNEPENIDFNTKANLTAPINASSTVVKENEQVSLSVSNYSSTTSGTGELKNLLRESSQKEEGPQIKWSVLKGEGTFSQDGLTTTFTPSSTGTINLRAELSDMNDFEDYNSDISISVQSSGNINLKSDIESIIPHCNIPISAIIPDDLQNVSYQWYLESNPITGATDSKYTPVKSDIGKKLSLTITPSDSTTYVATTYNISNPVENHSYSNGFCTKCDEREAAVVNEYNTCNIDNGGKLFWLAEQFDATGSTIPQDVKINIEQNINLEGSQNGKSTLTEGITKNRNFPILGHLRPYKGDFLGNNCTISDLYISVTTQENEMLEYIGLIGNAYNSNISNLEVEGNIVITGDSAAQRIGGIVGYADTDDASSGSIYHSTSRVSITNTGGCSLAHVAGLAGSVLKNFTIKNCTNFGNVNVTNSRDCIAGVVGYLHHSSIESCSNHGDINVSYSGENVYAGGVLGYLNSAQGKVLNCYNYGTVRNGGKNYCGAVIGRLRAHTESSIANNYYLNGSAPEGFGNGSDSTSSIVTSKTKDQFDSGEVCYLLNTGIAEGEDLYWGQNIDNNITPYDTYPVFTDTGGTIFYRSDGSYSNYEEFHNVEITWDPISFEYKDTTWDPSTHSISGSWSYTDPSKTDLTVRNKSNVAINSEFNFIPQSSFISCNLVGIFKKLNSEEKLSGKQKINANSNLSAILSLSSFKPPLGSTPENIGTITIKLSTISEV